MTVLRAIGRFFCRIGRWIRDTAWVQPLLIVGGIFAVIFSIKPISQAIQNAQNSGDAAINFYRAFQVSMSGADNNASSAADTLIKQMEEGKGNYVDNQKFFLCFVKEDCQNCKDGYGGFLKLRDNWNNGSVWKINDASKHSFKMYSIFVDEKNSDGKLLIDDLLRNHQAFFSALNQEYIDSVDSESYCFYNNISDSSKTSYKSNLTDIADTIGAFEEEEAKGFITPTTYLFNFDDGASGVGACQECFFNYTSDVSDAYGASDDFNKGYCLRDCWNQKENSIWGKDFKK